MDVVNLFAWRATKPAEILGMRDGDPVGDRNQSYYHDALANAGLVICAWGAHGGHLGQDETALGWIENYLGVLADEGREVEVVALGRTNEGHPSHPLYLPSKAKPISFEGKAR